MLRGLATLLLRAKEGSAYKHEDEGARVNYHTFRGDSLGYRTVGSWGGTRVRHITHGAQQTSIGPGFGRGP